MKEAIFKTLCYADIFDFPLTAEEIWRFLIAKKKYSPSQFAATLNNLPPNFICQNDGLFALVGRQEIFGWRKKKEEWSQEKLKKAQKIAQLLKIIPTLKMVAVTGAAAAKNSQRNDDIDFFLVTASGTLWLTRFLTTILACLTGQRRHPQTPPAQIKDKICLNMFTADDYLAVPLGERDLYTAHEVTQLKPLWDKDNTYQKFLEANLWVKEYLPNALKINEKLKIKNEKRQSKIKNFIISPLEKFSRWLQLKYMAKQRTTEVITDGVIRFHPHDARGWVLQKYKNRLWQLGLNPV